MGPLGGLGLKHSGIATCPGRLSSGSEGNRAVGVKFWRHIRASTVWTAIDLRYGDTEGRGRWQGLLEGGPQELQTCRGEHSPGSVCEG